MKTRFFKNRAAFRSWLEKNHDRETELWLVYYKVTTGKQSIKYEEAVQEALCFGWIDSTLRRIDDEKHMQKYTPRKEKSNWSASNKNRVKKLMQQGLMTEYGMHKIRAAKKNGSWNTLDSVDIRLEIPPDLMKAFRKNTGTAKGFEKFPRSRRKQFLWWITSAKREETRRNRIEKTMQMVIAESKGRK